MKHGWLLSIIALVMMMSVDARAQTAQTKVTLETTNNAVISPNGVGAITAPVLNSLLGNMIYSGGTLLDLNTFSLTQTFSLPPIFTTLNGCLAANLTGAITSTGIPCGSGGGGGSPGGSSNSVQYNSSGSFAGLSLSAGQILQGTSGAPSGLTLGTNVATALGNTINGSGGLVTSPVANANLANSSITIAGHGVSLGGSQAIACADLSTSGTGCAAAVASGTSGQPAYYNASSASIASETLSALIDANIGSTQGDVLYRGASTWSVLAPGTSGFFLETQGASANPLWAAASGGSGCSVSGGAQFQILVNNGSSGCSSSANATVLANGTLTALTFVGGYSAVATAAGTTTLTAGSNQTQVFTGSTTQVLVLPVTSTLALGQQYYIANTSTGAVTVESSGANTIYVLAGGTSASFSVAAITGTTAASWLASYGGANVASGKVFAVSNSLTLTGTDGTSFAFPGTSDTVVTLAATQTLTNKTISGSSNTLTNIALSSLTGLGTGVATALGDAVNTSGGFPTVPVANAQLANSTISGISLGSNLATLTFGTHLASGGSSYNGTAGVTITSDATNANTASTIVARDASNNFSAGTITASLTGHASLDLALSSLGTGVATALGNAANASGGFVTSPVANANLANASVTVNTVSCTLGSSCTISAAASLVVGSTTISSGTNTDIEFNNSGVLGEKAVTGSGSVVEGTSPTIATPALNGTPTGTGVATAATASTLALRDANGSLTAVSHIIGYTTTATAAGTTTLTVASTENQFFTGSTTQTVALPVASTLVLGQQYYVYNDSSGLVTVQTSGGNTMVVMGPLTYASFTTILTSGTSTASWAQAYYGALAASGKVAAFSNSLTFVGTDGITETFPSTNANVAALNITDQTLTGGANVTPNAQATGSFTVDCGKSPLQWIADTGAFTITAPTSDGACTLQIEMGTSAATPTLTGWTVGSNTGDPITTTSGNKLKMYITRIHSISSYTIQELQ